MIFQTTENFNKDSWIGSLTIVCANLDFLVSSKGHEGKLCGIEGNKGRCEYGYRYLELKVGSLLFYRAKHLMHL